MINNGIEEIFPTQYQYIPDEDKAAEYNEKGLFKGKVKKSEVEAHLQEASELM